MGGELRDFEIVCANNSLKVTKSLGNEFVKRRAMFDMK